MKQGLYFVGFLTVSSLKPLPIQRKEGNKNEN